MLVKDPAKNDPDGLSLPDLIERVRIAHQAHDIVCYRFNQSDLYPFSFTLIHLALLVCAEDPRALSCLFRGPPSFVRRPLRSLELGLAHFLKGKIEEESDTTRTEAAEAGYNSYQPSQTCDSVNRSQVEADVASDRDGARCVVTESSHPDIYHILPFALNSTRINFWHTWENLIPIIHASCLGLEWGDEITDLFCLRLPRTLGSLNKSWNMLSLSEHIHHFWSKALFGLKLIEDIKPSVEEDNGTDATEEFITSKVEFRWLSTSVPSALSEFLREPQGGKRDLSRLVKLDDETIEPIARAIHNARLSSKSSMLGVAAHHAESGRSIETGYIIDLKAKKEDAYEMKVAIRVQWVLMQMVALCGAANVVHELDVQTPPLSPIRGLDEESEAGLEDIPEL